MSVADQGTSGDLASTVSASSLSTLLWVDGSRPEARGAVSLWRADSPALAFTYADSEIAREVATSRLTGLAFTETRGTGAAFRPLFVVGRPRLIEDRTGDVFCAELLEQELRRFPPARLLADSVLLRREHWWYLPRLLVELDVTEVHPLEPRSSQRDHLLVTVGGSGQLEVCPAGVVEEQGTALHLDVGKAPSPGAALLFGQDASFPDLERWSQWRYRGSWDGEVFAVHEAPARAGLVAPLGLAARWRRQRNLERACRQALADR